MGLCHPHRRRPGETPGPLPHSPAGPHRPVQRVGPGLQDCRVTWNLTQPAPLSQQRAWTAGSQELAAQSTPGLSCCHPTRWSALMDVGREEVGVHALCSLPRCLGLPKQGSARPLSPRFLRIVAVLGSSAPAWVPGPLSSHPHIQRAAGTRGPGAGCLHSAPLREPVPCASWFPPWNVLMVPDEREAGLNQRAGRMGLRSPRRKDLRGRGSCLPSNVGGTAGGKAQRAFFMMVQRQDQEGRGHAVSMGPF